MPGVSPRFGLVVLPADRLDRDVGHHQQPGAVGDRGDPERHDVLVGEGAGLEEPGERGDGDRDVLDDEGADRDQEEDPRGIVQGVRDRDRPVRPEGDDECAASAA